MSSSFSVPDEFENTTEEQNEISHDGTRDFGGADHVTPENSPVRNRVEIGSMNATKASHATVSADRYDDSGEPRWFRAIQDVYAESKEKTLDEELLFAGIDEPQNFEQAVKEKV